MTLYQLILIYVIGFLYTFCIWLIFYFRRQNKVLKKRITDLEQDMVIPLYYAISNAKNIVLLNDDRSRMENHKEEYVKKYGYF